MTNMVTLIGRLTSDLQINEVNGKKVCYVTLAIPRTYKNADGVYETDFVDVILWNMIAQNAVEYCRKGDLLAVKGRIETTQDIDENENITKKRTNIIAEKISFLSTNSEKINEKVGNDNGNN